MCRDKLFVKKKEQIQEPRLCLKTQQTFNGIVFKNLQEDGVKSEAELKESRERLGAKIGK